MFNWLKNKIKRFWKWLVIGTIAMAATGAVLQPSLEEKLIDDIKASQDQFKAERGQYIHQPKRFDNKTNSYVTVNEYLKPDGQRGYWVIMEYSDKVKSVGYGPDAGIWTFEIQKIPEPLPTINTTST